MSVYRGCSQASCVYQKPVCTYQPLQNPVTSFRYLQLSYSAGRIVNGNVLWSILFFEFYWHRLDVPTSGICISNLALLNYNIISRNGS